MQILDLLFVIAAAFFVVVGVRRGLIGETFRLAAIIAGFFVAFLYYPELGRVVRFHPTYISNGLAFAIIFVCVALAVIGAGWVVKKIIHLTPLGWVDYIFGGALGFIKTALIFWIVCLSISAFPANRTKSGMTRSVVFKTYQKLPHGIKLDGVTSVRKALKKDIGDGVPRSLLETKQRIEELKKKVDSVKTTETKHR